MQEDIISRVPCIFLEKLQNRLKKLNNNSVPQYMLNYDTYEIVDIPHSWWGSRRSMANLAHIPQHWVYEKEPNPLEFIWPDKILGRKASKEERREYIRREYTFDDDGYATCESVADYWLGEFKTQYGELRLAGKKYLIDYVNLPYFVIVRDVRTNCWKNSLHVSEWIKENIEHPYTIRFESDENTFKELGYEKICEVDTNRIYDKDDARHVYDAMFFFQNRDEFFDFCKFWKVVPEYWVMENVEEAKELIND